MDSSVGCKWNLHPTVFLKPCAVLPLRIRGGCTACGPRLLGRMPGPTKQCGSWVHDGVCRGEKRVSPGRAHCSNPGRQYSVNRQSIGGSCLKLVRRQPSSDRQFLRYLNRNCQKRGPGPANAGWSWFDGFLTKPEKPSDFNIPSLPRKPSDGPDEVDALLDDDSKFQSWRRRRQILRDLHEARETGIEPNGKDWEDWLNDSWSSDYNQYVGGEGTGWYQEQPEWEKDGQPRSPPRMPERGMNRTIKELSLLAFFNQDEVEEDITFEERIFRYTSQQTAKIVAVLIIVPWTIGHVAHDFLLVPFLNRYVQEVPLAASLLDCRERQKLQMIETLRLERQRVKFEADIGRAPPLADEELLEHMHEEAVHLREEVRFENRSAFANIWSDGISALVFVGLLLFNPREVEILRITGDRIFSNVSDMGKAFLIILFTDIFLGYHSESGWETLVEIFLEHYGFEASIESIYIFVAIVPVSIDAFFKLWVFRALRKLSPSAAATFSQMKRH